MGPDMSGVKRWVKIKGNTDLSFWTPISGICKALPISPLSLILHICPARALWKIYMQKHLHCTEVHWQNSFLITYSNCWFLNYCACVRISLTAYGDIAFWVGWLSVFSSLSFLFKSNFNLSRTRSYMVGEIDYKVVEMGIENATKKRLFLNLKQGILQPLGSRGAENRLPRHKVGGMWFLLTEGLLGSSVTRRLVWDLRCQGCCEDLVFCT